MLAASCLGQDLLRPLARAPALVREGPPPGAPRTTGRTGTTGVRLLDQVRAAIRHRERGARASVPASPQVRRDTPPAVGGLSSYTSRLDPARSWQDAGSTRSEVDRRCYTADAGVTIRPHGTVHVSLGSDHRSRSDPRRNNDALVATAHSHVGGSTDAGFGRHRGIRRDSTCPRGHVSRRCGRPGSACLLGKRAATPLGGGGSRYLLASRVESCHSAPCARGGTWASGPGPRVATHRCRHRLLGARPQHARSGYSTLGVCLPRCRCGHRNGRFGVRAAGLIT